MTNSNTINEVKAALGLQTLEPIPNAIPVINVNPKDYKVLTSVANASSTTGSMTVLTTSSVRTTIVKKIEFSYAKNSTCDIATGTLNIAGKVNGQTVNLGIVSVVTLMEQSDTIIFDLGYGIKLDQGTAITVNGTFTVGALNRSMTVYYFELDNLE